MKNRYVFRARISERQFRRPLRLFSLDLNAAQIARIGGLSRKCVNRCVGLLRARMALHCEAAGPVSGEIEVDESYFGARRVRGKRGRGANGKTAVFGLLKRGGKVVAQIVPDCSKATLQAIIRGKAPPTA